MRITLEQPLYFNKIGQRSYNEDFCLPTEPSPQSKLFLLCDGMGGLDKGEDASKITATSINQYFEENPTILADVTYLHKAINAAHEALEDFMSQHPLVSKMGTTLIILALNETAITLAHIGDSRIYHIRNGQILYQTKDHKQVLDMVESGIITAEQAAKHPWRNRLSRSVSVRTRSSIDESNHSQDKPAVFQTEDIQAGDYFFMCTDGVLEQMTNALLTETLVTTASNTDKLNTILAICEGKTKDNYSGFLIQIKDIISHAVAVTKQEVIKEELTKKNESNGILYMVLLMVLITGFVFFSFQAKKNKKAQTSRTIKERSFVLDSAKRETAK